MYMRLAFSVAAHVDADVLIIDEALAVGDARFVQKCMRFLKSFKERGSILLVSHDLGAVAGLCDRAVWLDHGAVRGEGTGIHVCERYMASLHEKPIEPSAAPSVAVPPPFGDEVILYDGPARAWRTLGVTACSAFNANVGGFGIGGAKIVDAGAFDPSDHRRLDQITEGQEIEIRISAEAEVAVAQPILGFYFKDRLGQLLFGENTYRDDFPQVPMTPGDRATARFRFRWPALARGSYALTVSIADGTQEHHIQRHWLHDAVIFDVLSTTADVSMLGLPITLLAIERGTPPKTT
jgi:lipopolysaccharide transport system ATP-binding protein